MRVEESAAERAIEQPTAKLFNSASAYLRAMDVKIPPSAPSDTVASSQPSQPTQKPECQIRRPSVITTAEMAIGSENADICRFRTQSEEGTERSLRSSSVRTPAKPERTHSPNMANMPTTQSWRAAATRWSERASVASPTSADVRRGAGRFNTTRPSTRPQMASQRTTPRRRRSSSTEKRAAKTTLDCVTTAMVTGSSRATATYQRLLCTL
mmetsp:Transcript_9895/g.21118  ORF Transcript_9895/g.21118 Transcript_9895/m.21118 type:complete len:211 (-) Transcript_9895:143-775(-)